MKNTDTKEKIIEQTATMLVPQGRSEEWNQALMDYASSELKQHRIPIPKQSKLFGSNRYYRGQILKRLLTEKEQTIEDFLSFFNQQKTFSFGISRVGETVR